MTARERLELMIRTDRTSMTVWSPAEVRAALDEFAAEVRADERAKALADAADEAARHNHCACNNALTAAHAIRRLAAQPTQEQP